MYYKPVRLCHNSKTKYVQYSAFLPWPCNVFSHQFTYQSVLYYVTTLNCSPNVELQQCYIHASVTVTIIVTWCTDTAYQEVLTGNGHLPRECDWHLPLIGCPTWNAKVCKTTPLQYFCKELSYWSRNHTIKLIWLQIFCTECSLKHTVQWQNMGTWPKC